MFHGIFTALITPLQEDSKLDEASLKRLIKTQIDAGVDGLVMMGTTGESATFPDEEHCTVIKKAVAFAEGKVKIIAGCGSNDTAHFVELSQQIQEIQGIDGLLAVTPYYNKPNGEGLYQHYAALANNSKLPILLYNVPSRTGINMDVPTIARLANDFPNIVGIKDAVPGELTRVLDIANATNPDFEILSGEDATFAAGLSFGMVGCISVTSNIAPALMVRLYQEWKQKNISNFIDLNKLLHPLHKALFTYPNPIPAKAAAKLLGVIDNDIPRLPLVRMTDSDIEKLAKILKQVELL